MPTKQTKTGMQTLITRKKTKYKSKMTLKKDKLGTLDLTNRAIYNYKGLMELTFVRTI